MRKRLVASGNMRSKSLRNLTVRFPLGAWSLACATVLACGCTTTWAEIHGPTAGIGIEMDEDYRISPTVRLGYDYENWMDAIGWGGGGFVRYSPLGSRVELGMDVRGFGFPPPFIHLDPVRLTGLIGYGAELGWNAGVEVGVDALFFEPPKAEHPPIWEGEWNGCPATGYCYTDTVYPDYLPRAGVRAGFLFPFDPPEDDHVHFLFSAETDVTFSLDKAK